MASHKLLFITLIIFATLFQAINAKPEFEYKCPGHHTLDGCPAPPLQNPLLGPVAGKFYQKTLESYKLGLWDWHKS